MKRIWGRTWIFSVVLLISGILRGAAASAETDWRPVVFAYAWNDPETHSAWLIGGFRNGKWYGHAELPILVNGREITPEEGVEPSDPASCTTAFLDRGDRLAFYSAQSVGIGNAAVKDTKYSCSAASGEIFIDVETEGVDIPVNVMCIGVREGLKALTAPTVSATDQDRIIFSTGADAERISATFAPAVDEYGEAVYRGTLARAGKTWPLTDAYMDRQDPPEGLFIDLNGDGRMEFVLYSHGIAGFVAVWELTEDGVKEILNLDLGD